jgi:indole-3-glycerol phosphate synthase
VSVLTDEPFFGGSIRDLEAAARSCALPLLRKDFILDEVQILEARVAGASAVLLLVRILEPARMKELLRYAEQVGLDALVEVHSREELVTALESDARVIGVNSRDLDSFAVDTGSAWKLIPEIPADRIAVAESGLLCQADVVAASEAGADAVLVGTALSTSHSPEALLEEFARVPRHGR